MSTEESRDTYLYIGTNPKHNRQDSIASFTGQNLVPIGWFFLFTVEDIVKRNEEFPEQIAEFSDKAESLDLLEQFLNDPVAMRTSLPEAQSRLAEYREAFKPIPYLWSYFKVIEILERELQNFITRLEEEPTPVAITPTLHPETNLSQVQVEESGEEDNPFAELLNFGEPTSVPTETQEFLGDDDLLAALQEANLMDLDEVLKENEAVEQEETILPIVVYFDNIASQRRGERVARIPLLLERLKHHAIREGELTRVMQDLLQEIFREGLTDWRITGQLAEDFILGDPNELGKIMIGEPSPYVIVPEKLDLEYWTHGTLRSHDERLMYTLTLLPSEKIHLAIENNELDKIAPQVGEILRNTQNVTFPRLTADLLSKPAVETNLWGFRVLVRDTTGEMKPASIIISDPNKSWKQEFEDNIKLPGVLEDWNIEFKVRINDYSEIEDYSIVFEGAKTIEETFFGFVRWVRRHHIMYLQKYGVSGTINLFKKMLSETTDKKLGQLLFDILTNLTELGFNDAVTALSDEVIVRKLPWLYT